jgi:aryl-alcohol dehydrogenase-like predicted oxidoreductase
MRRTILGKTGIEVGALGFGGLFASSLGPGFEESKRAVHRALDLGIDYFDTAPAYADSEEILGRILRGVNVPFVHSTKLGEPGVFDPRSPSALRNSVERSLRRIGREAIDILYIHEPDRPGQYPWFDDPAGAAGAVTEVLDDLKRRGVIRAAGLGGTTCTEMAQLVRTGRFDVVLTAFNYSALFREAEQEVLPAARASGMGVVLGSVLQQGAMGRRFDDVVRAKPIWLSQARQRQFQRFYALLDELGMPIVELCLRFAFSRPAGDVVLIGPKTAAQVEAAVQCFERGPLPAEVLARLDEIAAELPNRPFEEPMILPFAKPGDYAGPGRANLGAGIPIGK